MPETLACRLQALRRRDDHGGLGIALVIGVALVIAAVHFGMLGPSGRQPQPPRPSVIAGQKYAAADRFLIRHPEPARKGMIAGVLLTSHSHGYICAGYCHTWEGTVLIPGGSIEHLASAQGDNGMASLVLPGDYFWFPDRGAVNAPSDGEQTAPVTVILPGAVNVP